MKREPHGKARAGRALQFLLAGGAMVLGIYALARGSLVVMSLAIGLVFAATKYKEKLKKGRNKIVEKA